jgi:hypothetical protein
MLSILFAAKSLTDYGKGYYIATVSRKMADSAAVLAGKVKSAEQAFDILQKDPKGHSLLKKYLTKEVKVEEISVTFPKFSKIRHFFKTNGNKKFSSLTETLNGLFTKKYQDLTDFRLLRN